ncbi:MAG: hypothetical protein BA873_13975 [Desulfobulbaceae bacterium C00003063]|nr:MAG: hypothetical protein BAW33_03525 [Desulfobacterales bacterium C00003104]OEU78847.1 MAG: hypothetical protein BA873_13975 [Desulfobulbaceae bacterium C00003063]
MFDVNRCPRLLLFAAYFLLCPAFCAWAQVSAPESRTVVVWGESAATGDASGDRQRALAQAKRNALEQVVGAYVTSNIRVRNFQVVEDRIYTKSAGFINSCTILQEELGQTRRIQIQARVDLAPVTEILKNSGLLRQWRIGVLLSTELQEWPATLAWYSRERLMEWTRAVEASIGRQIVEAGFKLVDSRHLEKLRNKIDPSGKIDQSGSYGIDLLVSGSALLAVRTSGGALYQSICQIHGKVLRVDTGEIVYQANVGNTFDGVDLLVRQGLAEEYADTLGNGQLSDGTPDLRTYGGGASAALDKAVRLSAAMMGDEIVSQITRLPAAVSSIIALEIQDLAFGQLVELEEELRNTGGVASLTTEEYSGSVNSMEVEYDGDAMMLARAISKSKRISSMGLEVRSVTKSKIVLKKQ